MYSKGVKIKGEEKVSVVSRDFQEASKPSGVLGSREEALIKRERRFSAAVKIIDTSLNLSKPHYQELNYAHCHARAL